MEKLIAAIAILGSIFLVLFKKYWSSDAEIRELKSQERIMRKAMSKARRQHRWSDYSRLNDEWVSILKKLSDLRR